MSASSSPPQQQAAVAKSSSPTFVDPHDGTRTAPERIPERERLLAAPSGRNTPPMAPPCLSSTGHYHSTSLGSEAAGGGGGGNYNSSFPGPNKGGADAEFLFGGGGFPNNDSLPMSRQETPVRAENPDGDGSDEDPDEYPPDHPWGYMIAFCTFLVQFTVFGLMNSFGVFAHAMREPSAGLGKITDTDIALANSVSVGLAPVIGIFAGFVVDRVGPRLMLLLAVASIGGALLLSAFFARSAGQLIGLYSILAAIASGLMTGPTAAATASWFDKKRALATGITFAGGGGGSMVVPTVAGALLDHSNNDWRWSFKMMSCFTAVGFIASLFVRYRVEHHKKRSPKYVAPRPVMSSPTPIRAKRKSWSTLAFEAAQERVANLDAIMHKRRLKPMEMVHVLLHRDFQANFWCFAFFSFNFYSMLYIAVPYAASMGQKGKVYSEYPRIAIDEAATLMTFMGVAQVISSMGLGWLATRLHDSYVYVVCMGIGAVGCAVWTVVRTYPGFAACMVLQGMCAAGAFAVMPSMIARHFKGPNIGFMTGLVYSAGCIGGLAGPPVVTSFEASHDGNYSFGVIAMGFCCATAGLLCAVFIRDQKVNTSLDAGTDALVAAAHLNPEDYMYTNANGESPNSSQAFFSSTPPVSERPTY